MSPDSPPTDPRLPRLVQQAKACLELSSKETAIWACKTMAEPSNDTHLPAKCVDILNELAASGSTTSFTPSEVALATEIGSQLFNLCTFSECQTFVDAALAQYLKTRYAQEMKEAFEKPKVRWAIIQKILQSKWANQPLRNGTHKNVKRPNPMHGKVVLGVLIVMLFKFYGCEDVCVWIGSLLRPMIVALSRQQFKEIPGLSPKLQDWGRNGDTRRALQSLRGAAISPTYPNDLDITIVTPEEFCSGRRSLSTPPNPRPTPSKNLPTLQVANELEDTAAICHYASSNANIKGIVSIMQDLLDKDQLSEVVSKLEGTILDGREQRFRWLQQMMEWEYSELHGDTVLYAIVIIILRQLLPSNTNPKLLTKLTQQFCENRTFQRFCYRIVESKTFALSKDDVEEILAAFDDPESGDACKCFSDTFELSCCRIWLAVKKDFENLFPRFYEALRSIFSPILVEVIKATLLDLPVSKDPNTARLRVEEVLVLTPNELQEYGTTSTHLPRPVSASERAILVPVDASSIVSKKRKVELEEGEIEDDDVIHAQGKENIAPF